VYKPTATAVKKFAAFVEDATDPVEADPSMGSRNRRSIDIFGMLVGIFGSKEQLINEYRIMLVEKLLNKSDYNIERETRTLELFKKLFGEGSMQRCEIMINDLTASKRTNANVKTTLKQQNQHEAQCDKLEEKHHGRSCGKRILELSCWSCSLKTDRLSLWCLQFMLVS